MLETTRRFADAKFTRRSQLAHLVPRANLPRLCRVAVPTGTFQSPAAISMSPAGTMSGLSGIVYYATVVEVASGFLTRHLDH